MVWWRNFVGATFGASGRGGGVLVRLAVAAGALGFGSSAARAQVSFKPPVSLGVSNAPALGQGGITVARAANGRLLAVWSDNRSGDHDVYGVLIGPAGNVIGTPAGFKIAGVSGTNEGDPRVAACGNRFLVVWGNGVGDGSTTDIFATRVNTSGTVLDAAPIVISNAAGVQHNQRQPASDGVDTFLVAFRTASESVYGGIRTMRVRASTGATLDPAGGVALAPGVDGEGLKKNASVSFGAGRFLVTWDDERDRAGYPGEGIDIFGAFVAPATGSVVGVPFATTRASSCQEGSRSAFDGSNFIVTHNDERATGCVTGDVYGERVSPAGQVLDPVDPTGMIGGLLVASDPAGYPGSNQASTSVTAGDCARVVTYADAATPAPNVALRMKRMNEDGSLEAGQLAALPGDLIASGVPSPGVSTRAEIAPLAPNTYLLAYALNNRPTLRVAQYASPIVSVIAQDVLNHPRGVASDAAGNIYVADTNNHRVRVYDRAGAFLFGFGGRGAGNGQLNGPFGIAVDAQGNIVVADTGNNRVQVFSGAGVYKFKFGSTGTGNGQFRFPAGIAVGPTGDIYVADTDNDRVQVFSGGGSFKSKFGTRGGALGQFRAPRGVAFDGSGTIFVIERDGDRVQVFSAPGVPVSLITAPNVMRYARGIAVDRAGRVIVANSMSNRVLVFSPRGQLSSTFGDLGANPGLFNDAASVAVDRQGRVLVVDNLNNRVQVFDCVP
ncbi:MAG: NHL repeat-containing protein [Phycisphaerae bacterium]|nr:NHL repeat-containing protein [Phycisphaerae bacterium]